MYLRSTNDINKAEIIFLMKIEYELVKPDAGSSFKLIHQKVSTKDFMWQYHYHVEYEITCVLKGSGTRHVGNHLSTYHNGDLVFIGSNLPHAGFGLNASNPHEEVVVLIKPNVLDTWAGFEELKSIEGLLKRSTQGICFSGNTKKSISDKLKTLHSTSSFQRFMRVMDILQEMAASTEYKLLNNHIIPDGALDKHRLRLQKVFTYVEEHYYTEIELKQVAELVNLSVPSFCNYFKKATNITFSEFVNNYRIHKACMLLLQHDISIAEVCYACGFNNVTYFNKVFKQIMRQTPSEYRLIQHEATVVSS